MDPIRTIRLRWWHGSFHAVAGELTRAGFAATAPPPWQPALNAFRCEKCVRICVDLAGVERSQIDLTIDGQRLLIRGEREAPAPSGEEEGAVRMIAMEIDYGPFQREVRLPDDVDLDQVHAEQRNGMLWISLPRKKS
jgi:HSP20 family protein